MKEKIILDCDNIMGLPLKEADDGLTLLYLLGLPHINLLGITTTFGNGTIEQVYYQTKKLVQRIGINIPVKQGDDAVDGKYNTSAARFLVEMVNQYPNEITILAIGPVGNLYAASRLDPDFYHKVGRIVTMGGYLGLHQDHKIAPKGIKLGYRYLHELNFSANPEAAFDMLYAPCPISIFPGQACLKAPFTRKNINQAFWWSRRFRRILKHWLITFGLYCGILEFYLWDLLPAVYLTRPHYFEMCAFPLGSTLQDLRHGLLFENPGPKAQSIQVAKTIRNQSDFYASLYAAWKRTAEKYPQPQL